MLTNARDFTVQINHVWLSDGYVLGGGGGCVIIEYNIAAANEEFDALCMWIDW